MKQDRHGLKAAFHAAMGVVLLLAGNLLASLPVDLFYSLTGIQPSLFSIVIRSVLIIVMVTLLVCLYIRFCLKRPLGEFRVQKPGNLLFWAAVAFLLPLAVSAFFVFLTPGELSSSGLDRRENLRIVLSALFSTCLVAGITEELIFRGFIMHVLEIRWGKTVAIFVPSLLFGALHIFNMENPELLDVSVLLVAGTAVGVMFSLIAIRSGSVWASAVVHGVWNLIIIGGILGIDAEPAASIWSYRLTSPSTLLTGGLFGIEASLPAVVAYGTVIAVAALLPRKAGDR